MKDIRRARRVGITAILCALLMRLWAAGLPERVLSWLSQPNTVSFLIYLETGRHVRFSSSSEAFFPDFVESPPPFLPEPTEPPLPAFSGEEEVELYRATTKEPDIPALLAQPLSWSLETEEPAVLILHTHSTESYTKQAEDYKETSRWRTLEEDYNMLSIGRRVGEILEEKGIAVIQDRQLHDYPSYNGSYTRARKSIREYLEEYPSIQLILDLHRDASGTEGKQMRTLAQVEGADSAQLMLVMGVNHQDYEENLSLSLKLHTLLEQAHPGLMRPLQLRAARFNQDLSPGAVLVEVGAAGNSHAEAMTAAEALAKAIITLARGTE